MASRKKPLGDGAAIAAALKERSTRNQTGEQKKWEARIRAAEEAGREPHAVYDECRDAHEGNILSKSASVKEKRLFSQLRNYNIEVNKLMPVLASQRERIVPRIPWFKLNPTRAQTPAEQLQMQTAEMVQNFFFRAPRMNFKRNMRVTFLGASLGYSAIEVCYTPDEGEEPEKDKKEELGEITATIDAEGNEILEVEGGSPLMREDGSFVRRGRKLVLDLRDPLDYFDIRAHSWDTLILDHEGTQEPEDMRFIGTRFVMPLEKALKNPIFRTTDKNALRSAAKTLQKRTIRDHIRPPRPYEEVQGYGTDDFLRVEGIRIWDAENREVLYYVEGLPDIAAKFEYPGWVDHSPIKLLFFNERLGSIYPQTEASQALPLLRAYSIFWCTLVNHLKRFKRKYGMTPTAFKNAAQQDMLLDPTDGLILQLANKNSLWPIDDAYLDPAIYKMMEQAILDFFEIMGSSPEFVGVAQSTSATQSAIIDRRGVGREQEKREIMKDFLEEVSDTMMANLQHNLPREIAVQITGPSGVEWKQVVARPGIQGRFKSWVDLQELEPSSPASDWQKQQAMVALFGPSALAQPTIAKSIGHTLAPNDPNIQRELQQLGEIYLAVETAKIAGGGGGGGGQNGNGKGGNQPPTGTTQGAAKPTGQGPEGNSGTEGRSRGREQRTLLGAGSSERPKESR